MQQRELISQRRRTGPARVTARPRRGVRIVAGIGLLLAPAIAVGYYLHARGESAPRRAVHALASTAPRSVGSELRAQATRIVAAAQPSRMEAYDSEEAPSESVIVEHDSDNELQEIEQRGAYYQQAFEREPRSPAWSGGMEETVRAAYPASAGVDAVLLSAECRSSLCRLEFRYADADARALHLSALSHEFEDLPSAAYAYPDERTTKSRVVAYFARKGFELPAFGQR